MAKFKEEWLLPDAIIPIDAATTTALVEEIKRMTTAVGRLMLQQAMADSNQKREWVGLEDEESIKLLQKAAKHKSPDYCTAPEMAIEFGRLASEALKEKNT